MGILQRIKDKVALGLYEYSKHAVDQSIIRHIGVDELVEAISNCTEIVEDYPDDKYGPSCLILGLTQRGRPLHIHCTYPVRSVLKVVTVYEPGRDLWIDFKVRRPKQPGKGHEGDIH